MRLLLGFRKQILARPMFSRQTSIVKTGVLALAP